MLVAGSGEIDQSLITGETLPATVTAGQPIYAGTLNLMQPLEIEVTAADSATLLAEIGRLMLAAEQGKARYRRLADRAAQIYAPAVHGLGLATFIGWLLLGAPWQTALTYAIAVLIITCPCALALAVPAVQIAAASRLFRRGIVVKAADGLERVAETDMVVFDKTGTLTLGTPTASRSASEIPDDRPGRRRRRSPRRARILTRKRSSPRRAAARRRGGAEESRRCPGAGSSAFLAQGEERLGSAAWCGVESSGGKARSGTAATGRSAGPLPLRRCAPQRRGARSLGR